MASAREHMKEVFIKKLKNEKVMSQVELAKLVDVKPATITKWLSGETVPDVDKIPVICEAFEITLNEFFGYSDDAVVLSENDKFMLEQIKSNPELITIINKIAK